MFKVRIEETIKHWAGSLIIGCTTSRPEAVLLPETLVYLWTFMQNLWIFDSFSGLMKHGCNPAIPLRYGRDMKSLDYSIGDMVGITRVGRKLKFYINGRDQCTAEDNLPPVVYPMVDVFANCTQVSIVSPGKLP